MDIKEVYTQALSEKYAIGAFNFYNLETLQAILQAAEESESAVICAVSESALKYMGEKETVGMFRAAAARVNIPAFLHLDHGKNFDICKKAIDLGFDSVMIDASSLSFEDNILKTREVVSYARERDVFVEAELGALAGVEDELDVKKENAFYTDPDEAVTFIKNTGADSLAIAIGTSHGAYKFKGESKLRVDILEEIESKLPNFPLVLHGASSVNQEYVEMVNSFGGKLDGARGVDENITRLCTRHNICKVNVDTDLRLAFVSSVRKFLAQNPSNVNPRDFLSAAREEMKNLVKQKITNVLGSLGHF